MLVSITGQNNTVRPIKSYKINVNQSKHSECVWTTSFDVAQFWINKWINGYHRLHILSLKKEVKKSHLYNHSKIQGHCNTYIQIHAWVMKHLLQIPSTTTTSLSLFSNYMIKELPPSADWHTCMLHYEGNKSLHWANLHRL